MKKAILLTLFLIYSNFIIAQKTNTISTNLDTKKELYSAIAQQIWGFAEMGYQEEKSAALLQQTLSNEGFRINKGVAGIPTAFIAEYGEGLPVIALLGEYDALPGLSQEAIAEKKSAGKAAGHACGHHLFGTASTAAAIEVKNWLKTNKKKGTIRFYGCPAEEGGSGKVYLVREGLFSDVDAALHWHPGDANDANPGSALANKSAKFRFYGTASHAGMAPEKGRSALDGIEAMNMMANMMREHIPSDSRIHYVITNGGKAPNVVPDFAEVYYYVRHGNRKTVLEIFDRIAKAAEGAALGTGTKMDYELIGGTHELLPNTTLQKMMHANLVKVGGFQYTEVERKFGNQIIHP
jgi:aminobenzoyl-glutamate utilization protein B